MFNHNIYIYMCVKICSIITYMCEKTCSTISKFPHNPFMIGKYACSTKDTFLQDLLEIRKRSLQNLLKILKKCFLSSGIVDCVQMTAGWKS